MIKVGLTGGIGSGKSTVSNMLKNKGIKVIDADIIAREVLTLFPETLRRISETFGPSFIDEEGKLKRKELGSYVFQDKERVKALEDILMPFIKKEIFNRLSIMEAGGEPMAIIDAPLLIEQGLHCYMDINILIWVDENTQLKRVLNRDKSSMEEVKNRISSQMPLDKKKDYVDYIIDNSRTEEDTSMQLDSILDIIKKQGGAMKKNLGNKVIILLTIILMVLLLATLVLKGIRSQYPIKYGNQIEKYSKEYNLDPYMVLSVIKAESNFKPEAKSSREACGLMQITPKTAEWASNEMKLQDYNIEKLYDPEFNIRMGCWYLAELLKEFNGDTELMLAAYNGGRGNVNKWLKDPQYSKDGKNLSYIPFKETDQYIKRVKTNYKIYNFLYKGKGQNK